MLYEELLDGLAIYPAKKLKFIVVIDEHRYIAKYFGSLYIYTVGPQLSEHLCATSMLKVFR